MITDNTAHLLAATAKRSASTEERANAAVSTLLSHRQTASVAELARMAGVSRSWLYAHPELLQQIASQSAEPTKAKPTPHPASDESLRTRLLLANQRNRAQADEITQLRQQIAVLHGQLREHRTSTPAYDSSGSSGGNSANESAVLR